MNSNIQYLADTRYSVTVPANSSASVHFAIREMGLSRVLVEPIYSPGGEENEPSIFFGPTHCKEILALQQMPMLEWLKTFSEKHFLPRLDSLEDVLAIEGLEELWLSISPDSEIADGIFSFLKDFSNETRIILLANFPITQQMPFRCADPTGKRNFLVCNGSWKEKISHSTRWHQSVALRGDGHSAIRTRTVL